ncbi:ribbon-helix-helix protein, CopG family [Synechocystis sp. LKSZ1]|uniref:ribbon-helix-helix protein, CopG family n=1 Tax=Synechocystis sp. LKSZ1 TaxID=3144951 RepID=UPI00336BD838
MSSGLIPTEASPDPATEPATPPVLPKRRRTKAASLGPSSEEATIQPTPADSKRPKKQRVKKGNDTTESHPPINLLQEQITQLASQTNFDREQLMAVLLADYAPPGFTTKQTTLRLEAKLLERLSKLCAKENLSREVLIEALFEHYEQDRSAKKAIITQAKQKASQRQALANQKRAKTMLANLHRLSQT